MNFKSIILLSFGLLATGVAQGPPECTVGVDTEECDVPILGEKGFFVCRVPPALRGTDDLDGTRPPFDGQPPFDGPHFDGPPDDVEGDTRRGRGGPRGPPLARARCIPAVRPTDLPTPPPDRPDKPPVECGCCGETCPPPLACGCMCDLTLKDDTVSVNGGMLVTIQGRDGTFMEKCVPAGAHADPNRVQCVATCNTATP